MNGAERERRKEDEKKNPARDCAVTPDAHVPSSRGRERGARSMGGIELSAKSRGQSGRRKELRAKYRE